MAEAYFDQIIKNLEILISQGRLKQAYEKCKRYLLEYPEEDSLLDIKSKIEKEIISQNKKVVDEKIEEVKPLWKEKDYVGIINALKPLLEVAPENDKLKKQILEAQSLYSEKVEKLQKEFKEKESEKFDKLLKEDEEKLLSELFMLEKSSPGNKQVLKLTSEYRDKIIKKRIEKKEDLIYSDKYEDIENFIAQLKRIDQNNARIKALEENTKKRKLGMQVDEKSEYVYKSYNRLDTLMRLGKYDKVVKVADEILSFDENSPKAIKIKEKAENKLFKQNRDLAVESITKNLPSLKSEYQKNKSKFIKI